MQRFELSEVQAQAILDMRLQRLTGLERGKIEEERGICSQRSRGTSPSLATPPCSGASSVMKWNTSSRPIRRPAVRKLSARRFRTSTSKTCCPTTTWSSPFRAVATSSARALGIYQQQRRGGKGVAGVHTGEDDFVQEFITTTNHQFLLMFTNKGRMHQLKVHQVPEGSRTAKGVHIANLVPMEKDEWVNTILTVREFAEDKSFLFATRRGMVKRSSAALYARSRKGGLIAVGLREDDELIMVREITDDDFVVLATADGIAIRFSCRDVRNMDAGPPV